MKVCLIVGTRPEVIKMSQVIKELERTNTNFFIIHSNQHYSPEMDQVFFDELKLPKPKYNLNVGSGMHSNQTGNILIKMEPILEKEKPDYVLVQGDTNTVLAGGLAAAKLGIKVGHIEAGLRSYDRTMPEETNRVVTDHLSNFLFAVTKKQKEILKRESIEESKINTVGNTIVDAVLANIKIAEKTSTILQDNDLKEKKYVLLTAHRASNVDTSENLQGLLKAVSSIADLEKVLWPIHPRAKKKLEEFNLKLHPNISLINPVGYLDFLILQQKAKIVLTDSGGLQEESCILGTPCLILRENTERPETIEVGASALVGRDSKKLKENFEKFSNSRGLKWDNPFGDGTASERIIKILKEDFYGSPIKQESSNQDTQKICTIGLGYMGLPMACLLTNAGHKVIGVDINSDKVVEINKDVCPFDEPGMSEILSTALLKGFKAQTKTEKADTFIISVPTPHTNGKCDLKYVYNAVDSILEHLEDQNLVIIESTIRPNTCKDIEQYIKEKINKNILLAHCPERAIPGNTIHELMNNDRIIGGLTPEATEKARALYSTFSQGQLLTTDATTAECCKLLENTFRDINIALANEFDIILKDLNVNPVEAIKLANHHPRVNILQPGPGVGGHCISIDPWFLIENTDKAKLIPLARNINDQRPFYWVDQVEKICNNKNLKRIAILGLAYKKDVDDTRESPSITIYDELKKRNFEVRANDPHIKKWKEPLYNFSDLEAWADIFIIATDHEIYKNYNFENKILIDTRALFHRV